MRDKERAQAVEKIMRLAWDSLQSHLKYTHEQDKDGKAFHKKCVKEYLEIMQEASKLW